MPCPEPDPELGVTQWTWVLAPCNVSQRKYSFLLCLCTPLSPRASCKHLETCQTGMTNTSSSSSLCCLRRTGRLTLISHWKPSLNPELGDLELLNLLPLPGYRDSCVFPQTHLHHHPRGHTAQGMCSYVSVCFQTQYRFHVTKIHSECQD